MEREYKGYTIRTKTCWTVNGANFNLFEISKDNEEIRREDKLKNAKIYIDNVLIKEQEIETNK